MRYEFDGIDRFAGGVSRSDAKVAAARRNGQKCQKGKGGRPSTRTLIERILNRPVTPKQWSMIREKILSRLLLGEQQTVTQFFGVEWTEVPHRSWRSIPPHVRQAMRHIKSCAEIYGRWPKWVSPTFTFVPLSDPEWFAIWREDYDATERAANAATAWHPRRRARS